MSHPQKTSRGWFARIVNALKGVLLVLGVGLIIAGIGGLFWNEWRAVKTTQALAEGQSLVQTVEDNSKIDPAMEGKLVYMTGTAVTDDVVSDPYFGISHQGIKLSRRVKYYQWVEFVLKEENENLDGSVTEETSIHYIQKWEDDPVDTRFFHEKGYDNSVCLPDVKKEEWLAENVTFGAFKLNKGQISRVDCATPRSLAEYKVPGSMTDNTAVTNDELYISWPPAQGGEQQPNTADPENPKTGDMRVSWTVAPPKENVSLIAMQTKGTFAPYVSKSSGYEVDLFSCGTKTLDEMFNNANERNFYVTWGLRFCGWIVLSIGLTLFLKLTSVVLDEVPILGALAEAGKGVVAVFLALVVSLVAFAVACLFCRPLLGIILLAIVVAPIVWSIKRKKTTAQSGSASANQARAARGTSHSKI